MASYRPLESLNSFSSTSLLSLKTKSKMRLKKWKEKGKDIASVSQLISEIDTILKERNT